MTEADLPPRTCSQLVHDSNLGPALCGVFLFPDRAKLKLIMTSDKEIWAMALWVEKHQGKNGWFFIAQQQDRLLAEGEHEGVKLSAKVSELFEELTGEAATVRPLC